MRYCKIITAEITELNSSAGDGAYDLHDVSGTPQEVGNKIGDCLAEIDLMRGGRKYLLEDCQEDLVLNLSVRISTSASLDKATEPASQNVSYAFKMKSVRGDGGTLRFEIGDDLAKILEEATEQLRTLPEGTYLIEIGRIVSEPTVIAKAKKPARNQWQVMMSYTQQIINRERRS